MKILHVLNEVGDVGNGIVNVAVDLACTQAGAGHQVATASRGGEFVRLMREHGVRCYELDQRRTLTGVPTAALRLGRILREFQPDVVHAHMMTGAVLAFAFRSTGRFRLVTTVHNEYQRGAAAMMLGNPVVAVSGSVAISLVRRKIPKGRIRIVRNGTIGSPRRLPLDAVPAVPLAHPAVVAVGAISARKGTDVLIAAFARVARHEPSAHLYLVGNRDWAAVEEQAAALGCSGRIHFEGFSRQPQSYLKEADVFVLPSRRDPFPLALLEAREAGVAIIASAVDGIPEALDDGLAGRLVPPGDVALLATALGEVLRDTTYREGLARQAGSRLDRFTVVRMSQEYISVYKDRLASRRPGRRGLARRCAPVNHDDD